MNLDRVFWVFGACFVAFFVVACSSKNALSEFDRAYYGGNKPLSYQKALKLSKNDLLWSIQGGVVAFDLDKTQESKKLLDSAESIMNAIENNGFGVVGATLINDNVMPYDGYIYEGVLINYYKALNYIKEGDYKSGRVEFNRASDRQRRAKEFFASQIQKALKQEAQKEKSIESNRDSIENVISKNYSNLAQYRAYSGFVNPYVSYVSALYFLLQKDYGKSMEFYKSIYESIDKSVISHDLKIMEDRRNGKSAQRYTWIFIEDGKSASKDDITIHFPSYIFSSSVLSFSISLPTIIQGKNSFDVYSIANGDDSQNAILISSLDDVIVSEFRARLPLITLRAITSSILKASTQSILYNQFGDLGALAGMAYTIISTNADVRISSVMPRRFLLLRVKNNVGTYSIYGDKNKIASFTMQDCGNTSGLVCVQNDNLLYLRGTKNDPRLKILGGFK